MRENEFWYWLQGFFELSADDAALTTKQIECIADHVMLASTRGENLITAATMIRLAKDGMLTLANLTAKLRELAASQFQHVIDPQAGGPDVQAHLNAIHHGVRPSGSLVARC
jgi:hypothetical protein